MQTLAGDLTIDRAPDSRLPYFVRVTPILLGRNARLWLRFRVSMAMDILLSLAQASVFFFIGSLLAANGTQKWEANYATFLVVGIVFNAFLETSLKSPYQSLAMDYWMARLETILLSPCPIGLAVVSDVGWAYIRAILNAVLFGLLGWAFGARVDASPSSLAVAGAALVIASLGVLGFGFMSAAMFMLINAKGWNDPVAWLVGILQGLVTGVYFPVWLLPSPIAAIALIFPQTYAVDIARRALMTSTDWQPLLQGSLPPIQTDFLALGVLSVISVSLGVLTFCAGLAKAQRDGGLSRWT